MAKTVIVNVDKFGNSKVDAEGFVGQECKTATEAFEKVLARGADNVGPDHKKPEFYQSESAKQTQARGW